MQKDDFVREKNVFEVPEERGCDVSVNGVAVSPIDPDEGNVLVNWIRERTLTEWYIDMDYDPKSTWPPGFQPKQSHTKQIKDRIARTTRGAECCLAISTMMIASLRARDPRLASERQKLAVLADHAKGRNQHPRELTWFNEEADGAIVRGPTRCGKSHFVKAFTRLFPPFRDHGHNEACGWTSLRQLVYLSVSMPADATRSGLQYAIVTEIDKVLGTSYTQEYERKKTLEKQLVYLLLILSKHRCGVLFLEENQIRNLGAEVLGKEFVIMFLRLMNVGIPLVMIGNPVAFENVMSFSQDLSRCTENGLFECPPVYAADETEWTDELVPAIWGWNVFDKPDEVEVDPQFLFNRSGGIPGLLARYRRQCVVAAMMDGSDCVKKVHLDVAWESNVMTPVHDLIAAHRDKDVAKLMKLADQAPAWIQRQWEAARARRKALDMPDPYPPKQEGASGAPGAELLK